MIVRRAAERDVEAIREVAHVAWEHTYSQIMKPQTRASFLAEFYTAEALRKALRVSPGGLWVAEEAGLVLGFIQVVPMLDKPGLEITRLYVLPDKQRSGVGSALLAEVTKTFSGFPFWALIESDDESAVCFYLRKGFSRRRTLSLNLYGEELRFVEFYRRPK